MKENSKPIWIIFIAFLICLLIPFPGSDATEPKKVAILPFTMNADRDLSFLQEGIVDMLASRLAWKGEVDILEKGRVKQEAAKVQAPLNREKALLIGKALGSDYVILGSLTVFGDSVSIDAKIMDVAKGEELITAFSQTRGMDDVIPTVNGFAEDINAKIMGRVVSPPQYARTSDQERKGPPGLIKLGDEGPDKEKRKVVRLRHGILGMDIGDVDGDGQNEMVCINNKTLFIYKWREGTLSQIRAIEGRSYDNYVWIDVADLNNDGRAEIIVSSLIPSGGCTFVWGWQGNTLVKLAQEDGWFSRVIQHPTEGQLLIGQKRYIGSGFAPGIHRFRLEKGGLVDKGEMALPRDANVFNFVMGSIVGQGQIHTVLINKYDALCVYDQGGEELWKSGDKFGGSLLYMVDNVAVTKDLHLTPRILLTDVDFDGKLEVAICRNQEMSGDLLDNLKFYKSGELQFLTWDGMNLAPVMKSIKLTGAITDYQVRDVDNDGQPELVVVFVREEGQRFLGASGKSGILVIDLK